MPWSVPGERHSQENLQMVQDLHEIECFDPTFGLQHVLLKIGGTGFGKCTLDVLRS